jgi:hypothetical protein
VHARHRLGIHQFTALQASGQGRGEAKNWVAEARVCRQTALVYAESMTNSPDDLLFEADTPLGFRVRVGRAHWEFLVRVKHPAMAGREADVSMALVNPDEVRRSRTDPNVLLFYKTVGVRRWVCAVCRRFNGEGFLITAYPTDAIKEGEHIWPA